MFDLEKLKEQLPEPKSVLNELILSEKIMSELNSVKTSLRDTEEKL